MGLLRLKSEPQIVGDQISKFLAETGINGLNPGSAILTLLEANAQEIFQQYVQLVNVVRNYNLDSTTGEDLDKRGFEFGLTRRAATKASGKIKVQRDAGFTKVSSSFYSGLPAPVIGDTVLRVNDASNPLYSSSGTLIIGRGTSNEEEVTFSVAPSNLTNYWEFTVSPFAMNHGLDESVILKQGTDQVILAGTVIVVPAAGSSAEVKFTVDHDTTLLSGEAEVAGIEITAQVAGSTGNIPIRAITGSSAFASAPFAGARAENDTKFTTGGDLEVDDDFRNRIKNQVQSLSKATKRALLNAIIGLVDTQTAKRVVSANIIQPSDLQSPVKVYIDDGTGFEPSFDSQGLETILDQATGGENRLQLDLAPVAKAQVENNLQEPYNMSAGTLSFSYTVGLQAETIQFLTSDFEFPASATAEEVAAIINNKATLIEARTSDVGKKVVISAIQDTNEEIQVTGGSANGILGFPTDSRATLYLYVDGALLSKDGSTAYIDSSNQEAYDFASLGSGPWPLNVIVDGKSVNPQVVSFTSADFASASAATAKEVLAVINAQLSGAEASLISNDVKLRITSNKALSSKSKIQVTGGTANTVLGFQTTEVVGSDKDYTFNRELGTIELVRPLTANQDATLGSQSTRGRLRTASPELYSIISGQTLVVAVDGGADQTITFSSTSLYSAAQIAALINAQLQGATAIVRTIGGLNYLEINTNTFTQGSGSIRVQSTSTATALNFTTNTTVSNQRPHKAFVVSGNGGPYNFVLGHNLVMVLDNAPATKTFTVVFDFAGTVTAASSTTVFSALALNTVFPNTGDLIGYKVIAKSGANTTTGTVTTVANVGGNTWRYSFASLPANLADMAAGDHTAFSNMQQSANNGNFLITAVDTTDAGYIEVTNTAGVAESSSSGSAMIGQRRTISAHTGSSGQITVSSAFRATPSVGDTFAVLPATLKNTVAFFNNKKVTTLSTKAAIEASNNNSRVQISSLAEGSDGYVQVTGGSANDLLAFSTSIVRGLQGYNYYTGLLKQVHRTIYGDDQDLVSYPGVGAAGVEFQILAPTVQEITFNLNVSLAQGVSITNVADDIKSAITGYVNSLGVGEDVVLATVIQKIMEVDNVEDVEISTPTGNVVIADNELARTSDSKITIG